MASQLTLADSIKQVHQQLRHDVNQTPDAIETIWNAHVANVDKLNEYAQSMRELAEHHWAEKAHGRTRITWCYDTIKEYFHRDGGSLQRRRARDARKQIHTDICDTCQERLQKGIDKPRVLDVGSCYNAFAAFDDLETIAIDIAPADESVHRIDFLRVPMPPLISVHTFDVVVFCLVLDYLPTCRQRLSACLIAHQLLTCFGLLLIVEPDSSLREKRHTSWRQALQLLGFASVAYVKVVNLHCMAFRKLVTPPTMTDEEQERLAPLFNIPQDTLLNDESSETERSTIVLDEHSFDELPFNFE